MNYTDDIEAALRVLKDGGVILYPTDTVWGLGCDPTNKDAVERIFRIKKRGENKSLIILVNGTDMLKHYVVNMPEAVFSMTLPANKPLTIIYPEGRNLAAGVCSEDGSVGIRICSEPFCKDLISDFGKPVVSTSANTSGSEPPSVFEEIEKSIIASADYVVKYRRDDIRRCPPSSIMKAENDGSVKIIRP